MFFLLMTNSYPRLYIIALCKLPMKIPNDPCICVFAFSWNVTLFLTSTYGKHDGISQALTAKAMGNNSPLHYIRPARETVFSLCSEEESCHIAGASMKMATWKLTVVLANNQQENENLSQTTTEN